MLKRIAVYSVFFVMTAGASYVAAKKQGPAGHVQARSESPSEKDGSSLVQWIPTSRFEPHSSEIRSEALALSVALLALQ